MAKKKKQRVEAVAAPLTTNPFAALSANATASETERADNLRSEHAVSADESSTAEVSLGRVVVRYQRKGRGGKEVTLVEKLDHLGAVQRETLCRSLKRVLGCGGHLEGTTIVIAGDQRERLPTLLERQGAAVTVC